jgi:hypothetical protein
MARRIYAAGQSCLYRRLPSQQVIYLSVLKKLDEIPPNIYKRPILYLDSREQISTAQREAHTFSVF